MVSIPNGSIKRGYLSLAQPHCYVSIPNGSIKSVSLNENEYDKACFNS